MSLINDALKKAQRERTQAPEHPAAVPPPPPANRGPAPRGELRARSTPWPAVLIVVAIIAGGAAVWFLKPSGQPATAPAPQVAANSQTPATPTPPTAAEPAVQLQFNAPGQPTVPAPQPAVPAPVATPAPAPAPVTPAPIAQPAPAAEPLKINLQVEDPRILAFLDSARVQGIRSVADDAKLLMNNKVYRAGAVVDRELGLKLMQILPTELVFEDSHGIQYRKLL